MTEQVRAVVERYLEQDDVSVIHPDAYFVDVSGGVRHEGRSEISKMFHAWYTDPFDASADLLNVIIGDSGFVAEYEWEADHVGVWMDHQPTNKRVQVRFAVVYEVSDGHITSAHVYMPYDRIRQQLTSQ